MQKKRNPHCHYQCDYEWCRPVRYCGESGLGKGKGKGKTSIFLGQLAEEEKRSEATPMNYRFSIQPTGGRNVGARENPTQQSRKGKGYSGYKGPGGQRACHVETCPQGCTPFMYGGISASDYKQKMRDFLGDQRRNIPRRAEKDACESVLGNMPKDEQEMPEEEQEPGGEIEEKGRNGRCVDALRNRSKSVQKDTKRTGTEKTDRSSRRKFRISKIQTEAGPLKDQDLSTTGAQEARRKKENKRKQ